MNEHEEFARHIHTLFALILTKQLSKVMAEFLWSFYCDLKKVGFSEEQALHLCKMPDLKQN